jgi:hypothetical protein
MTESLCFLCGQARADLISLAQLRTTLTAKPLIAVFCTALALAEKDADAETICLKCSELLDQIDTLGLQLKLKTDELRTLYYSSRKTATTGTNKVVLAASAIEGLAKEDSTKLRRGSVRTRTRPTKRPPSRQCPCHTEDGRKKCASSCLKTDTGTNVLQNVFATDASTQLLPIPTGNQTASVPEDSVDNIACDQVKILSSGPERVVVEQLPEDGQQLTGVRKDTNSHVTAESSVNDSAVDPVLVPDKEPGSCVTGRDDNGVQLPDGQLIVKCPVCDAQITGDEAALGKFIFALIPSYRYIAVQEKCRLKTKIYTGRYGIYFLNL